MSAWTIKFISFQLILLFPILVLVVTFSCLASYIDMPFVMVCEHLHKQENNNTRTYQKKKTYLLQFMAKKSGKRNEGKTSKTILCANGITKPKQKPVVMLHTHTHSHMQIKRDIHTHAHTTKAKSTTNNKLALTTTTHGAYEQQPRTTTTPTKHQSNKKMFKQEVNFKISCVFFLPHSKTHSIPI